MHPTTGTKRILITSAGGGTTNNLIRGLRAAREDYFVVGTNIDKTYLAGSLADRNYLVPRFDAGDAYLEAIRTIIDRERIDVLIPNNDLEVPVIAAARETVDAHTFLPSTATIERCQDKFALHELLVAHGHATSETHPIHETGDVDTIFRHFPPGATLWCRMRRGNGSKGALPVKTAEQAVAWIRYWNEMREIPVDTFTLGEYLPGRDFAFQSMWFHGELVIAKTCERLEYLYSSFMPSGTSSTPRVGRLTVNEEVNDACVRAITDLDRDATGMFCVDLKENEKGVPIITEINVGRFFQISEVFNTVGEHNMAELFVRLACGEPAAVPAEDRFSDIGKKPVYLLRDTDRAPIVIEEEEMERRSLTL